MGGRAPIVLITLSRLVSLICSTLSPVFRSISTSIRTALTAARDVRGARIATGGASRPDAEPTIVASASCLYSIVFRLIGL